MEERGDKYCLALFGEKEQENTEVDQRVVIDLKERGVKESPGGRSTHGRSAGRERRREVQSCGRGPE